MTPREKAQLEENLKPLLTDGIFTEKKWSIAPGKRVLIVSYGGAGADALYSIKQSLQEHFTEDELRNCVRLLAIDTDPETATKTEQYTRPDGAVGIREVDTLGNGQFFCLNYQASRAALMDPVQRETMKEWLNPDIAAMLERDFMMLNQSASATRQIGKVALAAHAQQLYYAIRNIGSQLCRGMETTLEVIIISGISGSTGSGIVIDATYIIHDALKSLGKKLLSVNGFIMLPPTGLDLDDPVKVKRGNRNGYAALKEIDHFMTTVERRDKYEQTLGTLQVTCNENLFDACFLVDAARDTVLVDNPRECAKSVITNAVVDAIATRPDTAAAAHGWWGPESFLALDTDDSAFRKAMLQNYSAEIAPRDVNYIYHAIGNSECYVPISLIKTYIARETYTRIVESAGNNLYVSDADAIDLVRAVILPSNSFNRAASEARVDEVMHDIVRDATMGPYYAVNLLYRALEVGKGVDAIRSKSRFLRPGMVSDEQLNCIASRFHALNTGLFEVFTAALDVMQRSFDGALRAATDTGQWNNGWDTTYTFTPIHLGNATGTAAAVKQYIDGMVDPDRGHQLMQAFMAEMMDMAWAWTDATATMADRTRDELVGSVRSFWESQIGRAVDDSIEDYLIKYYTGDKDAKYDALDPKSDALLDRVAAALYQEMFGNGLGGQTRTTPLLGFTGNRSLLEPRAFNSVHLIFVPETAPHLKEALDRFAAQNHRERIWVYPTTARERISCFTRYSCVPAFKIRWVTEAETAYEDAVTGLVVGMHMSESRVGKNWTDAPSLCPESTWLQLGWDYGRRRQREKALADRTREWFAKAKNLGLTGQVLYPNADWNSYPAPCYYEMSVLDERFRPDVALYTILDSKKKLGAEYAEPVQNAIDRDVQSKAQALYAIARPIIDSMAGEDKFDILLAVVTALEDENAFGQAVELRSLFNTPIYSLQTTPDNWYEDSAAMQLRRRPECFDAIRGTLDVFEAFVSMCLDRFEENRLTKAFEAYLAEKLIYLSAEQGCWVIKTVCGVELSVYTPTQCGETAPLYYVFNELKGNEEYRDELHRAYITALKEQIKNAPTRSSYAKDDPETYSIIMAQDYAPTIIGTVKQYSSELCNQLTKPSNAGNDEKTVQSPAFELECIHTGEDYAKILTFYKRLNEDFWDFEAAVDNIAEYAAKLWCEVNGIQ